MADQRTFRILHLASSERWTGVADPVASLAAAQQAAGHSVWLGCVPGQSFEQRAREKGLHVLRDFQLDRRLNPQHFFTDFAGLRRFVKTNEVDIVHTHLLNDNWLAALALTAIGRDLLLARTFHRWEQPRRDPLHQWLFRRRNDLSIVTSKSLLSLFDGRIALEPGTVHVVYGGVDSDDFTPRTSGESIRREFDLASDTPLAGYVSRLNHGRGHDWLLAAAPEIRRRLPEARIMIAGKGPLKKPLRHRVGTTDLRDNVIMIGYRSNDLRETYAAFDVALFLGIGNEGTCRAALEAMATGRPIVAPRATALPEIVEHEKTGLLVEPGDTAALAEAIVRLLSDRDARERMGRAAREAVLERFTNEKRGRDTLEAYRAAWAKKFGGDS